MTCKSGSEAKGSASPRDASVGLRNALPSLVIGRGIGPSSFLSWLRMYTADDSHSSGCSGVCEVLLEDRLADFAANVVGVSHGAARLATSGNSGSFPGRRFDVPVRGSASRRLRS